MLTLTAMTRWEVEMHYPAMTEDFPPSELKPLPRLLALFDRGVYDCWWLTEDNVRVGYAALLQTEATPYCLLDYLAIREDCRGGGYGSRCLELLKARYPKGFIVEAEAPEEGLRREVNTLRRRRIAFYQRAGCTPCPFENRIFGVRYLVHLWAPILPEHPFQVTADGLRELYRCQLPSEVFHAQVAIQTPTT